jgi:hypothetical protein
MYAATGLIVLFLVIVRGLSYGYRPPRPAPPDRAKKGTGSGTPSEQVPKEPAPAT